MHLRCVLLFKICCLFLLTVQAHPGIGLVYDGNHTLYYTDLNHVWQLDTRTGDSSIYIQDIHTHELAIDSEGNLYGEHYWYEESQEQFWNYIWKKALNGNFQKIREDQVGENVDFSFVRDSNFNGYAIQANNGEFEITKSDSLTTTSWHTLELNRPGWRYLTKSGDLIFSDYPKIYRVNGSGVGVIAPDLSSSRFPFSLQDKTHHIYGIWEDQAGAIYVALYGGRQIVRINPEGEEEIVLKTGLLWSPVNGVIDRDANLWLMEARMDGAIRLRKVEKAQLEAGQSFNTENVVLILMLLILGMALLTLRKWKSKNRRLKSSR